MQIRRTSSFVLVQLASRSFEVYLIRLLRLVTARRIVFFSVAIVLLDVIVSWKLTVSQ